MSASPYTLLIVDDFAADRELYCRSLQSDSRSRYRPIEAESVAEGLELCQSQKIDGVLLDYLLPDADGLEFLAALSELYRGNPPPVVMLTGQGSETIAVQAMKLGAQDYLVKRDLTPALLQLTMRTAIENARLKRQLAQCQERFRISIDNMRECVSIFSAIRDDADRIIDFRFDYLNPAALANNRMTARDVGRSLCEVFPAVRASGLFEEYCNLVETGQPLIREDLVYEDVFAGERLRRNYSVHATKLDDGFVSCWRDETAKRETEIELASADRKIIEIWESITDAYVTVDRQWRVIYANQAATQVIYQLTNLKPEAFLGRSHWDLFPSLVGTNIEREYRRSLAEGVPVNLEIWFEPTGDWFEIHLYPSGEGLGIYFRDITDRKQLEAERLEAIQERDRFFNMSLDLLAVGNFDGYFERINPAFEQLLGFTRAEFMERPFIEFVYPDDRESTLDRAQSLAQGEIVVDYENRCLYQDGSYRWISWNATPYVQSRVWYAVGRDITDRKREEAQLLQAQATIAQQLGEIEAIYHNAPIGLGLNDTDLRYMRINDRLAQINGAPVAEHSGKTVRDVLPELADRIEPLYRQVLESGQPILDLEISGTTQSQPGMERYWSASYYPQTDAEDRVVGVNVMVQEITDRKRLELERLEAIEDRDRFFNLSIDLLVTLNFDGYFTRVNPAWERTLGFTTAELMARPFTEFIHPDDRALTLTAAQDVIAGGVLMSFENRYLCKDGSYRWLLWSAIPYPEQDVMYGIAHDITDRKQQEAALRQSEQKFSTIFNQAFQLIGILSVDGRLREVNQTALDAIDIRKEDVIGREFWETPWWSHSPQVQHQLRETIERVAQGELSRYQMQMPTPCGTIVDIDFSLKPVFDETGRVAIMVAEGRDITDFKQAERALQASERKFSAIFEQSFELMGIVSLDGVLLEVNQTALDSIQARREDIAGKLFWETPWWHTEQLQQQLQDAIASAASGEFIRYEVQFPHPSGAMVITDFSLKPVFDDAERVVMLVAEAHDITERKRAERDLLEAQERLRAGIEVAGVGLARFDYATNLVALSPEAASLYGFSADTTFITREQIHDTFHPDERTALEQTISQVINPEGTGWFAQDHRVVWPCGEVRCLSVRKQVFFDRSGAVARPSYAILAAIDITDRKQTLADLEARNQELDSFVHIVSHDLKAPLRAISNLSQWIEEDLEGSLPAASQEQMNLLRERVYRMEATIDGLLEYARIGRVTTTSEPVSVAQLVAETIDSIAPPQTFNIAIAKNLPTIYTNRILLSQVFANLIGNGIKHHDRVDGSLHIGIAERGNLYEFAIADDGPGIAPEHQERMFKIFQAVNPQNRSDSTGIGLAIVKKIVEAEGGTIRLESQLGRGTTFYFTWPKS
jgi:PAS domain S-box-containing protein